MWKVSEIQILVSVTIGTVMLTYLLSMGTLLHYKSRVGILATEYSTITASYCCSVCHKQESISHNSCHMKLHSIFFYYQCIPIISKEDKGKIEFIGITSVHYLYVK